MDNGLQGALKRSVVENVSSGRTVVIAQVPVELRIFPRVLQQPVPGRGMLVQSSDAFHPAAAASVTYESEWRAGYVARVKILLSC